MEAITKLKGRTLLSHAEVKAREVACVALAALLHAGCIQPVMPPLDSSPAPPIPAEHARILVKLQTPTGIDSEFRFNIAIVAANGEIQEGFVWQHNPETTHCLLGPYLPTCPADTSVLAGGDFHNASAEISPSPYAVFEQVAYNGTWAFNFTRAYYQMLGGDIHNQKPRGAESCFRPAFSQPNATLRLDKAIWAAPACYGDGTVMFHWPTKTWDDANATILYDEF